MQKVIDTGGVHSLDENNQGTRGTIKGIILVLAQALPIMAVVPLFPAMPRLTQQFDDVANAAFLVPMIITLPSLCIALLSPLAGWLIDRFGRRLILNTALAMYTVTGLAPLFLNDLTAVVFSRGLLGAAEACIVTAASTLIADYFAEQRYRWLAIQSALGAVLGTLLIALGGWLADASWRGPFAIYAVVLPLFILALLFIDEPKAQVSPAVGKASSSFPWKVAFIVGSVSFIASVLYYVEPTHIASIFHERGVSSSTKIGIIQALTSLAYIAGAFLYKRLHDQPIGILLGVSGGLIGIGMIGIGLSDSYQHAAFWALFQQLGAGMVIPSLTAWAQASVPFEQRGRAMGIWATFFFTGLFFCPTVVTLSTSAAGGLSSAFWWLGLLTSLLAIVGWVIETTRRHTASAH